MRANILDVEKRPQSRRKKLIKQLATEGNKPGDDGLSKNPVIAMTGFELFFDWNIHSAWKKIRMAALRWPTRPYISIISGNWLASHSNFTYEPRELLLTKKLFQLLFFRHT